MNICGRYPKHEFPRARREVKMVIKANAVLYTEYTRFTIERQRETTFERDLLPGTATQLPTSLRCNSKIEKTHYPVSSPSFFLPFCLVLSRGMVSRFPGGRRTFFTRVLRLESVRLPRAWNVAFWTSDFAMKRVQFNERFTTGGQYFSKRLPFVSEAGA